MSSCWLERSVTGAAARIVLLGWRRDSELSSWAAAVSRTRDGRGRSRRRGRSASGALSRLGADGLIRSVVRRDLGHGFGAVGGRSSGLVGSTGWPGVAVRLGADGLIRSAVRRDFGTGFGAVGGRWFDLVGSAARPGVAVRLGADGGWGVGTGTDGVGIGIGMLLENVRDVHE